MGQVMEMLQGLDTIQIILLAIGGFLLYPLAKDKVLPYVTGIFSSKKSKDASLVDLVGKWEELRQYCQDANLEDACEELDKVFPMLVDAYKKH